MQNRRDFLKIVGTTAGGILLLPKFLHAMPASLLAEGFGLNGNVLVFIQMNGGNDGLNTFIPYADDAYYANRPAIAIKKDEVLNVGNGMGFHPALKGFSNMLQAGHFQVIQNVGYPNPDRSHFRSQEIWQTAANSTEYLSNGWLGTLLDATCKDETPIAGLNFDSIDNLALKGSKGHSITIKDPQQFEKSIKTLSHPDDSHSDNPNLEFVRKLALSSFEGHDQIQAAVDKSADNNPTYPNHGLAKNLSWIARLIKGGLSSSVYYTSLGGFDTHANQLGTQKTRLTELDESVFAFYQDLSAAGLLSRVTLVMFSEFGRRVKDNGSGTDHGTAAPMFLMGGGVKGIIRGKNPNLTDLDNGDLKYEYDFRSIYAALIQERLGFQPSAAGLRLPALGGLFG